MTSTISILANITSICNPKISIFQQTNELRTALLKAYDETIDDPDTYATNIENVVFGNTDPKAITDAAENWNHTIHNHLTRAIRQYLLKDHLDSVETNELVKAAMAANNEMHCYARELLFNMVQENRPEDTDWTFSTILHPHQICHILTHPEDYAVCELNVK